MTMDREGTMTEQQFKGPEVTTRGQRYGSTAKPETGMEIKAGYSQCRKSHSRQSVRTREALLKAMERRPAEHLRSETVTPSLGGGSAGKALAVKM